MLVVLIPFLTGELPAGQRYGDCGPVTVRLGSSEPTNIYLESEFPAVYREPSLNVFLENDSDESVTLACQCDLVDYGGSTREVRPPRATVTLESREEKRLSFVTDPSRGVFAFRLRVNGTAGDRELPAKEFVRMFAVVPAPGDDLRPDTFFRLDGAPAWQPYTGELCRRMGAKAVRVLVEPGRGDGELFDGRVAAAKARGVSLQAVCPSSVLGTPPATAYGTSTGRSTLSMPYEMRWGTCTFRLVPGEGRPELLAEAARRVLHGYGLEGQVDQLAYLLAHGEESARQKLKEIGILFADRVGEDHPEPGPFFLRTLDRGANLGRRFGVNVSLSRYHPEGRTMSDAASLVAGYALASLAGLHAVSALGPNGILEVAGRKRLILAQAHATLAHFLRGRVPVADVWPRQTLLFGCVYSRPDRRPKEIERAAALAVRDEVLGMHAAQDHLKVGILFSSAVPAEDRGELYISESGDLAAYDLTGNPTGLRRGNGLSVPFGCEPVYVTTYGLTVEQLLVRLRRAEVRGLRLFHCAPQPFTRPGLSFPALRVLLDNSDTRPLAGTLAVSGSGETKERVRFDLQPGEVKQLKIDLTRSIRRPDGVYPFTVSAVTRFGEDKHDVSIPTAIVWPVSAKIDGSLTDWEKQIGLRLADADGAAGTNEGSSGPVLRAGYDTNRVCLAVSFDEPDFGTDWEGELTPDALRSALAGSALQIAFGFAERSQDSPYKAEDPWYWKGAVRDTDHLYLVALNATTNTADVLSLHEPGMVWGESLLRGAKKVEQAEAACVRSGTKTVYEVAIPRSHLKGFSPELGELRLGLVMHSGGNAVQLSRLCGIPEYLASGGSFLPADDFRLLPNQVWWGIAR
jgi:hypothetical protein